MPATKIIITMSILLAFAAGEVNAKEHVLRQYKATDVSENPVSMSGFLATFVRLKAQKNKREVVLYIPYMNAKQIAPRKGDICNFTYKIGNLDGVVGVEAVSAKIVDAKIITKFTCR